MTERDSQGRLKEQLPNDWLFDSESGKRISENHSWENKREEILKQYPNLWEEYKNE